MTSKDQSTHSTSPKKGDKPKKKPDPEASTSETLLFVFSCGGSTVLIFFLGVIGAAGNGAVYPILAYLFSSSFADISSASIDGLAEVRELAYTFMIVGAYALVLATIQTMCFETAAVHATKNLRMQWFRALIRQDAAFFDVYDIGGIASNVGPVSAASLVKESNSLPPVSVVWAMPCIRTGESLWLFWPSRRWCLSRP